MNLSYRNFPHPWPTMAERDWICDVSAIVAERFEDCTIVHIGVVIGISLYASYGGAPDAHIVGVDLDVSNFKRSQFKPTLLEADSGMMDYDGDVHFLFVDGDHSIDGVAADLEAWLDKVPIGGIVGFHDYWNQRLMWCRGVSGAVDAWDWDGREDVPAADSIKALRRVR